MNPVPMQGITVDTKTATSTTTTASSPAISTVASGHRRKKSKKALSGFPVLPPPATQHQIPNFLPQFYPPVPPHFLCQHVMQPAMGSAMMQFDGRLVNQHVFVPPPAITGRTRPNQMQARCDIFMKWHTMHRCVNGKKQERNRTREKQTMFLEI